MPTPAPTRSSLSLPLALSFPAKGGLLALLMGASTPLRAGLAGGASLPALAAALGIGLLGSSSASANCATTGSVTLFQCDAGGVNIQPNASGTTTLSVSNLPIPSGWINYSVRPTVLSGPITMSLNVSDSSVVANGNGAINVSSQNVAADITVVLGPNVTLENSGGSGGLWIRNQVGGNIVVTSDATITSTGSDALTATSNAGSVSITNTGTVTSTDNRGIYADGSPTGGTTAVPVFVRNSGVVNAYLAGIRVIDYLGTASLENSGTATSSTRQGLIAWSQSGDASIVNSGSVLARNYIGVQAMADAGNVTVTNSGVIEAQRDTTLGAATTFQGISASGTNVTVTNTATGRVTAAADTGILAETANGTITVTNAGQVTGTAGIAATATIGSVSVSNTGTIVGTSGVGVSLNGTTNRLENAGVIRSSGAVALQTGNGDSTVVTSGQISAGSASGTAIAMGSGNNRLVLADTATLVGNVTNTSRNNTLELAGSASGGLALDSVATAGVYQGFAHLTKSGSGTWSLSGTSPSLSGAVMVEAGSLVVNGSLASASRMTVAAGASIGGSGIVPSLIVNGTLAPGNSPGTLTVAGNLTLGAGSTYMAEIQGAVADRVNVTGSAALAGTLRLVALGGSYQFNNPYTLLSAAGGAAGTFGTVDTTGSFGAGVATAVNYTASDVLLTLSPKALTPLVMAQGSGASANVLAVSSALDRAMRNGGNPSGFFNLYNLPAGSITPALNQLSGEAHAGTPAVGNSVATHFLGNLLDANLPGRLSGATPGPGAAAFTGSVGKGHDVPTKPAFLDQSRFALWGSTFGSFGRVDGDFRIGSAKQDVDDAHIAVGADFRLLPDSVAGVAVSGGKARSSLSGGLGKIETDVFQAGLYGSTKLGPLNLSAAGGYTRLDNDGTRSVPVLGNTLTSSYVSTAWSGRLQASATVLNWNGLNLSPLAALQAVHVRSPAFFERASLGGNAGALSVAGRNDMTSRSELGLQVDAQTLLGGFAVAGYVRASWAHYFQRDADVMATLTALPGASFITQGTRPDRNGALLSAGVDTKVNERVTLGVRLDSELSANTRRLGGTAQIKVSF